MQELSGALLYSAKSQQKPAAGLGSVGSFPEKSFVVTFWRMAVLCYFNLRPRLLCFRPG